MGGLVFWQRGYCNIVVPCRELGVFLNRNHKTQEIIKGFSFKIRKLLCTLGLTEKITQKGYGEVMSSLGHPCHTTSLISFLWGESFIQVSLEDCPNCKVDLLFFQNFSAKCRREVTFRFTLRIYSIISQSLFGFSLSRLVHDCWEKNWPEPCDSWKMFRERRGRHNMVQDPSGWWKGKNCALQSIQGFVLAHQLHKIVPGVSKKAEDEWIIGHLDKCYA